MKKILIILTLFCVTFSCREDDDIKGSAVGFYPVSVEKGEEEGATVHTIALQTSGVINSDGIVKISVANGDFLTTVPPMNDGVISLVFPKGTRDVSFDVTVGDDNFSEGYSATFDIVSAEGGIEGILGSSRFTLLVTDIDQKAFFFDDFESKSLCKWLAYDAGGSNNWEIDEFNNTYARVSSFLITGLADDWLIMPEINFDNFENEFLVFESQTNFNDGNVLEVVVLTDYSGTGDPSGSSAIALSPNLDTHTGGGFGDFTLSTLNPGEENEMEIDLSNMTGTGHVAFHYKAVDANDGSTWQIDNVLLSVNDPNKLITEIGGTPCGETGGGGGGGGGGGSSTDLKVPFTDDFEDCANAGDFNIPANWTEAVVAGSKTDRGWGCRAFGNNGSQGVRASAFAGEAGTDDAWLISNGTFDLTSLTSIELKFWIESRFSGPGAVTVHWSTNYTGSGDPSAATWTELTNAGTQITAITAEVFTEITVNLDAAAGNNIFLAFRYAGGTNDASIAYTLDDLSITGN
jgi:hypothetical protein